MDTNASQPKIVNASNPASFGVEWTADSGSRYCLVNGRGSYRLTFGTRISADAPWVTTSVEDPARFGMTEPPKTFRAFLAVVEAFIDGGK
jgi:hypothetical protein